MSNTSAAPAFTFEDAERPASTSTGAPNEFAEVVGTLAAELGENVKASGAKRFTMPVKSEGDRKACDAARRRLGLAGKDHDVSVRQHVSEDKGKATITFWVVPKITRPRNGNGNGSADESATEGSPIDVNSADGDKPAAEFAATTE
jgi:hypothetical protein